MHETFVHGPQNGLKWKWDDHPSGGWKMHTYASTALRPPLGAAVFNKSSPCTLAIPTVYPPQMIDSCKTSRTKQLRTERAWLSHWGSSG